MDKRKITDGRGLIVPLSTVEGFLVGTGKSVEDIKEFFNIEYNSGFFSSVCQFVGQCYAWSNKEKKKC